MPFTPLDASLLSSSLLRQGTEATAVFMLLLAGADRYGVSDMTPSAAASLFGIPDKCADAAFDTLSSPDPRSRSQEQDGRRIVPFEDGRWLIVNHAAYRKRASKAYAVTRQQRHREKGTDPPVCEAPGCGKPAAAPVDGRWVCPEHAFTREPGEEG